VFSVGPFSNTLPAGEYYIFVDKITLGGIDYTPKGTTSFSLRVYDPCNYAVITVTAPVVAYFSVFDAIALYSMFTAFSYTS
jgi:hypothetical protein